MQKVSQILNQVGFAAFSRIQSDLPIVREKLGLSARILGMISFPLFFGIASVSPEIVDVFLGEKWLAVTAPLGLLAIAVPLRMINTLTPTMLFSVGRPGVAASNSLIAAAIMIPMFFLSSTYGDLTWVCAVWLLGYPAYFAISTKRALSIIDYSWLKYMGRFAQYLLLAALMLLAIFSARSLPQIAALPDAARLIIFSMFGAILYVGTLVAVDRDSLLKVWRLARSS